MKCPWRCKRGPGRTSNLAGDADARAERAGRAGAASSARLHHPRVGGICVFLMQLGEVLAHADVGISGLSSCPPASSPRSHPLQTNGPLSRA